MNSRSETGFSTKEEGGTGRVPNGPSNYRPWSRQKDPRIVRVSPSFGGKDRHSKVCTVRGLRDRRVRLSVQTAIQLYDLQDRLGLSQPSKVVDWLLTVAQHDIDKLPPLQMPVENFVYPQSMVVSNGNVGNVAGEDQASLSKPAQWNSDANLRAKCKEVERETKSEKSTWIKRNDGKSHQGPEFHGTQVITPLNDVVLHGACYYQWESPSFHVNPI